MVAEHNIKVKQENRRTVVLVEDYPLSLFFMVPSAYHPALQQAVVSFRSPH
jgi:hypothetical protein